MEINILFIEKKTSFTALVFRLSLASLSGNYLKRDFDLYMGRTADTSSWLHTLSFELPFRILRIPKISDSHINNHLKLKKNSIVTVGV